MWIEIFCLITLAISRTSAVIEYSYGEDEEGPAKWYENFPKCAKSKAQQCPINIQTADVIERSYPPFVIVPNVMNEMKIENPGHTIQMSFVDPKEAPTITGGPLHRPYKFAQLHFHWHSETRVDDRIFPLEMHMVFYNTRFPDVQTAMNSSSHSALAVLAVLFEERAERNPNFNFVQHFKKVRNFEDSTTFDFHGTAFTDLLPLEKDKYRTFYGSLTTPPCSPITKWAVLVDTLPISHRQLLLFGHIHNFKHHLVKQNWRTLQDLNDRKIYINRPGKKLDGFDEFLDVRNSIPSLDLQPDLVLDREPFVNPPKGLDEFLATRNSIPSPDLEELDEPLL